MGGRRGADLGLIDLGAGQRLAGATLREVATLKRFDGFLYQWYDTDNGSVLLNPGQGDCAETTPASGQLLVHLGGRQRLVRLGAGRGPAGVAGAARAGDACSRRWTSRSSTTTERDGLQHQPGDPGQPADRQMYGGYYVDQGPAGYHNGALYSDPRIAMYMGMGLHQMPGDVWWRTWRSCRRKQCCRPTRTSPGRASGRWRGTGRSPTRSRTSRSTVWEGHYTYPGTTSKYMPTYAGGMFEGLMANQVVPETTWGPHSFGLADARTVASTDQVRDRGRCSYPVWGMSPSSTADDTGGYGGFGVEGQLFGAGERQLAQCTTCATETTVTPACVGLALPAARSRPTRTSQKLRAALPRHLHGDGGFYDAVNPTTGAVGHRQLVLDQSMIMAALDNALNGSAMQRYFAADPVSWAARTCTCPTDDVDRLAQSAKRARGLAVAGRRSRAGAPVAAGISSASRANRLPSTSPIATSCSPIPRTSSIIRRRSRQIDSALRASSRLRQLGRLEHLFGLVRAVSRSSSTSRWAVLASCWLSRCAVSRICAASRRATPAASSASCCARRRASPRPRVGVRPQLLGLALGLLKPVVGARARPRRDLLGGVVGVLEDVARLLADLVERVPHRRLGRRADLELGQLAVDVLDVAVDRGAVIAAQRDRELGLARLLDHPVPLGPADDRGSRSAASCARRACLGSCRLGRRHGAPAPFCSSVREPVAPVTSAMTSSYSLDTRVDEGFTELTYKSAQTFTFAGGLWLREPHPGTAPARSR